MPTWTPISCYDQPYHSILPARVQFICEIHVWLVSVNG